MDRRSFLIRFGGALIAVPVVIQATACGDDGDSGGADAAPATSFTVSSTGSGHTHQLTVQCSQVNGSVDITLTSTSASAHTHQVTVTAAQLAQIAGGQSVTIDTTDGHSHSWTFSKPSGTC